MTKVEYHQQVAKFYSSNQERLLSQVHKLHININWNQPLLYFKIFLTWQYNNKYYYKPNILKLAYKIIYTCAQATERGYAGILIINT